MIDPVLTRNEYPTPGLRQFLLIMHVVMFAVVIITLVMDDALSAPVFTLVLGGVGVLMMATMRFHAHISLHEKGVRVGFLPLYRRTLPYTDMQQVEAVSVRALRDYGGWGIRMWPRSKRGMLLSAGGEHGVSMLLNDGRRYVVGCAEPVDDLIHALRERVG